LFESDTRLYNDNGLLAFPIYSFVVFTNIKSEDIESISNVLSQFSILNSPFITYLYSMESYALYDLNEFIRRAMHLNFPKAIWVRAEVAQIKESRGQHYLTLVQKSAETEQIIAQIDAMIWGRTYRRLQRKLKNILRDLLQDGVSLLLEVKVEFNERYGLKLMIEDIDPSYTIGQVALKRQQILMDLLKANLLNINKQLAIAPVVQRIAVLSSSTAAGLQDYLEQLNNNPYQYTFKNVLFPIAVQGVMVEKELQAQLKKIALKKDQFDAVVLVRGGGSKIDLGAFDSFELAKTVAKFPLPVIVGIGHEVDETILDRVAHTSLKTPTAVADFLIRKALHFESWIMEHKNYLASASKLLLQEASVQLEQSKRLLTLSTQVQLKEQAMVLQQLTKQLPIVVRNTFKYEQTKLAQLEKIAHLLTPSTLLNRGYTQTTFKGKTLTSVQEIKEGMILETHFVDGTIKSKVV